MNRHLVSIYLYMSSDLDKLTQPFIAVMKITHRNRMLTTVVNKGFDSLQQALRHYKKMGNEDMCNNISKALEYEKDIYKINNSIYM